MQDVEDMKQREAIFGLTVGIDFKSLYDQNKEIRRQKIEENKELTKYEGKVPINQRLVLLTADFLEAIKDVDQYEYFIWRSNFQSGEEGEMLKHRVSKVLNIIKQLFRKYQLEIVRPNIDYVINKYQSAIDGYDQGKKQ